MYGKSWITFNHLQLSDLKKQSYLLKSGAHQGITTKTLESAQVDSSMVSNRYERNLAEFVKGTQWQTNTNAIMCMFSFSSKTKSTKIAPKK